MDLIIKDPEEKIVQEQVSLKPTKPKAIQAKYEAEKVELSDNIRRFDKIVKVYTQNPYTFNAVSKRITDKATTMPTQTATQMITNPTYNQIGKFLGVDTVHDWGRYYDKVYVVTEWAKEKVGDNHGKMMGWLTTKLNHLPQLGARRIDDLYIAAKLDLERKRR